MTVKNYSYELPPYREILTDLMIKGKNMQARVKEERSQLIRARAAGRSWDSLAEEYGVSKAAVQIQVARGRKGKK